MSSRGGANTMAKRSLIANKNNPKASAKSNPNSGPQTQYVSQKAAQESRVGLKSVKNKVLSKDLKKIANISFITTEEFASIPK